MVPLLGWIGVRIVAGVAGTLLGFFPYREGDSTEEHGQEENGREKEKFDDVAGIDEIKEQVEEIVEFLKEPKKHSRLGAQIPKGVLLYGPPGTGKTLLARAIAGEAEVPFSSISGSDFVEMYVGVGASRVRDMFKEARKIAPCIVFIDEIDAVGRSRETGIGNGGDSERAQTLNQLLVEMDGVKGNDGVIIIAATNRLDVLDSALQRPGRFDRKIYVPTPDVAGRKKILDVHVKKRPLGPDVDLAVIARGTPGFSGADLANLVNEAALLATRLDRSHITMEDFEQAKDKIMLGPERSKVMTEEERRRVAYHEAGHAIVGMNVPQHDPVYKVSVIPRGDALGVMVFLPEKDHQISTMTKLISCIKMAMGGNAAEEIVFGPENISTSAKIDLQKATHIAGQMVTEFGMSPKLGKVSYSGNGGTTSEESKKLIEEEIRRITDECWSAAKSILKDRREDLDRLAKGLLEYETLAGEEIKRVLAGESLDRGADAVGEPLEPEPT